MKICIYDLWWDWSAFAKQLNRKALFVCFFNLFLKKSEFSFLTYGNVLPMFSQFIKLQSYTLILHINVPHWLSKTCSAYFAFYFIPYRTWTHHDSSSSFPRAANHSQSLCLWSRLCFCHSNFTYCIETRFLCFVICSTWQHHHNTQAFFIHSLHCCIPLGQCHLCPFLFPLRRHSVRIIFFVHSVFILAEEQSSKVWLIVPLDS